MSGGRGRILAFSAQYANGGTYRELKPLAGDVDSKDIKTREPTNIPFVAPVQAHLRHEERRRKWRTKYLEKEKKNLSAYLHPIYAIHHGGHMCHTPCGPSSPGLNSSHFN